MPSCLFTDPTYLRIYAALTYTRQHCRKNGLSRMPLTHASDHWQTMFGKLRAKFDRSEIIKGEE